MITFDSATTFVPGPAIDDPATERTLRASHRRSRSNRYRRERARLVISGLGVPAGARRPLPLDEDDGGVVGEVGLLMLQHG
ncbi:MAG: hypothetical protein LC792_17600, partial [Actinobacteria bacterium]|nr:hypothetical protein [Actinomycetota bacterium]